MNVVEESERGESPAMGIAAARAGGSGRPSAPTGDGWAQVRRYRHFYFFVAPFFILFAVFGLYPLIFSLFLSFVKWDGLTGMHWVGLGNFVLMAHDDILWTALWNTLVIGALYVPPMMIMAFVFAQLLNAQWLKFRALFRAALFLPCVTPMVVIAIIFGLIFSTDKGVLNFILGFARIAPIPWLTSEDWSKSAVAILVVWRWTGYNMVLMLAGLQGIPRDYYEAAQVDGASSWQRTTRITLPLMTPIFRFCGLLSLLGTIYLFDEVFVLTNGGPGISSTNFGLYLFELSFDDFKFGYASCVAYSVAIFVFACTLIVNRLARRGARELL